MFILNKQFFTGKNEIYSITAVILFIIFLAYYFLILYLRIGTDVQVHADMAYNFFKTGGSITPNFLYYFLVALLAGFSKYKAAYYASSIILLSGAVVFKFLVNVFYLRKFTSLNSFIITLLAVMLLFIFSLPGVNFFENKDFYLGQLSPNVWHNSTVIFLAPFSVILFFETINLLDQKTASLSQQVFIFILILLNAVIKPSFLFTIIPVVLLFWVYRFFKSGFKETNRFLLPYIAGILFIAFEYVLIYKLNGSRSVLSSAETSSVIFSPFEMWGHFSASMPVAFITSCLFPIIFILYTRGAVLKDQWVLFAALNFLIAILIWILFIETGFRRYHGNFYWQVVTGSYLLFFTMLLQLFGQAKNNTIKLNAKKMLLTLFTLHFLWGVIYWGKIIWFHGYS